MANITINIEGDLNIMVDAGGEPDCLWLTGTGCCPIGAMSIRFGEEDEEECPEADAAVLYISPGNAPIRMTLYDALNRLMDECEVDTVELLSCFDALIAFDSSNVICSKGCRYLAGPAVVFMLPELDMVEPLDAEDEHIIRRILEESTVKLTNGSKVISAYRM